MIFSSLTTILIDCSFDVRGNGDQGHLFLRIRDSEWSPATNATFNVVGEFSVKQIVSFAILASKKFGIYSYPTNTCQDWNNLFLHNFNLHKRTMVDWLGAWGLTTFSAAVAGFCTYMFAMGPAIGWHS